MWSYSVATSACFADARDTDTSFWWRGLRSPQLSFNGRRRWERKTFSRSRPGSSAGTLRDLWVIRKQPLLQHAWWNATKWLLSCRKKRCLLNKKQQTETFCVKGWRADWFVCMWTGVAHLQAAKLMQIYAERRLQEDKAMRDLVQQVAEGHMNSKTVKEKLRKMKQNIGALWHPTCCCCLLHAFNSLTLTPLSRFMFGSARGLGAKSRTPACGTGGGPSWARQEISNHQGNPCSRIASSHSNQEFWRHRGGVEKEAQSRSHYFSNSLVLQLISAAACQTAGHGLLGEMSLFELKERLAHLREAQRQDQREKRERILKGKERDEKLLQEKQEAINLQKRAQAHLTALRRVQLVLHSTGRLQYREMIWSVFRTTCTFYTRNRLLCDSGRRRKTSRRWWRKTGQFWL